MSERGSTQPNRRTVLLTALGAATGSVATGTAGASGDGSAGDWTMHRRDPENTAANRAAGALKPPLVERWRTGPLSSFGRRTVATSGETVFLTNQALDSLQHTLRAHAASDGALLWEFRPAGETVEGTPAVVGDTVYAGGDALYAVAAGDGSERFRFDAGDDFGPPVVAEGMVLVAGDETLYALDAATGALQWTFDAGGLLLAPPSVARGVAYLGVGDEAVVALDVASGAVRWQSDAPARLTAVFGGSVVANSGGDLAVLSASDGRVRWRLDPPSGVIVTAPVVAGGRVFVLTESIIVAGWDDGVHAYDLATGRRRWHRAVGASPFFERATDTLALGGNALYVGDVTGGVTALHPQTGRTLFRFDLDEPLVVSPVAVRGGLYLAGSPNQVALPGTGALVSVVEADRTV